jgi:hypothetical protein
MAREGAKKKSNVTHKFTNSQTRELKMAQAQKNSAKKKRNSPLENYQAVSRHIM